jgi:hypothetical protein
MARPSSNDPIEPMDLANMRENGVRSLAVRCWQRYHETIINVDHLPGTHELSARLRLTVLICQRHKTRRSKRP